VVRSLIKGETDRFAHRFSSPGSPGADFTCSARWNSKRRQPVEEFGELLPRLPECRLIKEKRS
jgi:hypothetical protein